MPRTPNPIFQLSPTKINTFRECPAKYRWDYIDKLGRFYRKAKPYFSFGTSIHAAMHTFSQSGGPSAMSKDHLIEALHSSWVTQGYANPEEAAQKLVEAEAIMETMYDSAKQIEDTVPAQQRPILFASEKTYKQKISEFVQLTGRIDKIDLYEDNVLDVIDYKSGRLDVTEEDVSASIAMRIYQTIVKHHHPDHRVQATIVAVRTSARASFSLSDNDRHDLIAELAEEGEMLRNKDWSHVLPIFDELRCETCDYRPHCNRIWKKEKREYDAQ